MADDDARRIRWIESLPPGEYRAYLIADHNERAAAAYRARQVEQRHGWQRVPVSVLLFGLVVVAYGAAALVGLAVRWVAS